MRRQACRGGLQGSGVVLKQNSMKPRLKSSPAARELIKRYQPYLGIAQQGGDGTWRVGYGHTAAAKAGVRVSEDEASLLLIYDVIRAEEAIDSVISAPLSKPQRDALVSFVHGVGVTAFKQSDVARYLFEGRAMAAGEAIALYGDADADRREAESALFLASFAPPKRPAVPEPANAEETVELVIKIEHGAAADEAAAIPAEERELEAELADAGNDLPPPPPPPMPTARREAEDEISRILASVGEIALAESVAETAQAEAGAATDPVVEPDLPELPLPRAEVADEPEPVAELPVISDIEYEAATTDTEAEPDVTAGTEIADSDRNGVDDAVTEPDTDVLVDEATQRTADPRRFISTTSFSAIPLDSDPDVTRVRPESAPEPDTLDAEDQSSAEPMVGEEAVAAPVADEDTEIHTTVSETDLPPVSPGLADAESDTVSAAVAAFTPPEDAPEVAVVEETPETVDPSEEVLARMNAEISGTSLEEAHVSAPTSLPADAMVERALPEGTALGYVLAGELVDESSRSADLSEAVAESGTAESAEDATETAPQSIEDQVAERMVTELADGLVDDGADLDQGEIIETPIAVSGDDNPPPHPAETPAASNGSVGEVEVAGAEARPNAAVTGDDILASDFDPVEDDDLTPQDLAGDDLYVAPSAKPANKTKFPLGYVLFGLFFATIGALGWFLLVRDWQFVLANPQLTPEVAMGAFGPPLAILCLWFAVSDYRRSRKQAASVANSGELT